ncbi:hypothetical protein GCM10009799_50950 [Nocardiopsis rhodophaea]|uniref:Uncharacterized protein n=1 Tax=Nocardiopsis rhodophaea TaxID=280238 RepID=A0ABP5F6Q9_9ACTN
MREARAQPVRGQDLHPAAAHPNRSLTLDRTQPTRRPKDSRFPRQPQPPRPRPAHTSSRRQQRRAYHAYKPRAFHEPDALKRALYSDWELLPYSCTIFAVMFLVNALDLLT